MMPEILIAVIVIFGVAAYLLASEMTNPDNSLLDSLNIGVAGAKDALGLSGAPMSLSDVVPRATGGNIPAKVIQFAQAIAHAEGFYIVGSVPNRAHNPGDLGPGDCGSACLNSIAAKGSTVCQLTDDATGWALLYQKLQRIVDGRSSTFNVTMTFEQFALTYVGRTFPTDAANWATHVASDLGVSSQTTIAEWLAS